MLLLLLLLLFEISAVEVEVKVEMEVLVVDRAGTTVWHLIPREPQRAGLFFSR